MVLNDASNLAYDTYSGELDVTFVRLQRTAREYKNTRDDLFSTLSRDLRAYGLRDEHKLYAVFFEGAHQEGPSGGACGVGGTGYVFTYVWNPCATDLVAKNDEGNLSVTSAIMAHELVHGLGAVKSCAPNAYAYDEHTESPNYDLMATENASVVYRRQGNAVLDPGRDDYFRHGRTDCDDIANSVYFDPIPERWLESPSGLGLNFRSLSVDRSGSVHGVGFIAWTDPNDTEQLFNEHVIYEISPSGELLASERTEKVLLAIHASRAGSVYIGGYDNGSLLGTKNGKEVSWWQVPHSAFRGGVVWAVTSNAEHVVASSKERVALFTHDGVFISSWEFSTGSIDVTSIAIDSNETIYIATSSGISKYTIDGLFKGQLITTLVGRHSIAIDAEDNLYVVGDNPDVERSTNLFGRTVLSVASNTRAPVLKLDSSGTLLDSFGEWGMWGTNVEDPRSVAIGSDNSLYVVDRYTLARIR